MKKIFLLILLTSLAGINTWAYDLSDVEDGFQSFSDDTASSLPLASNMGLNWNDAYSGGFPHFGLGLTAGAVFMPSDGFQEVASLAGNDILADLSSLGVPLPIYSVDARLGLPAVPLDVGVKLGILNPDSVNMGDFTMGFQMFGADVRWGILEDKLVHPGLSLGAAYTWLGGNITLPVSDQSIQLPDDAALGNTLNLTGSDINYDWQASVLDFKAQVSKKVLMWNLSAGIGYSYGFTRAGGGIGGGVADIDGLSVSDADKVLIEQLTGVSMDSDGVSVDGESNAGSVRLFGGVGFSVLLFKMDFGVLYGVPSKTLGMTTNLRIQF